MSTAETTGTASATGAALVQPAPPEIDDATARAIARDGWGVDGPARALGSHQDRNFLIEPDGGPRVLLKVANPSVTARELEAQSAAAAAIDAAGVRAPRALPLPDGATARSVVVEGVTMQARLLEFLEGETLEGYLSRDAVTAIGTLAATVDVALADLDAPGAERVHQWDLREAPGVLDELLPYVEDDSLRAELAAAARTAWDAVEAVAARLPMQFIHGDLTDDNVVTADPISRVPDGVIDLGDLNRTWTVGELAITVSSLLHHDGMDLPRRPARSRRITRSGRCRPTKPTRSGRSSWSAAPCWSRAPTMCSRPTPPISTPPRTSSTSARSSPRRRRLRCRWRPRSCARRPLTRSSRLPCPLHRPSCRRSTPHGSAPSTSRRRVRCCTRGGGWRHPPSGRPSRPPASERMPQPPGSASPG